MNIIRIDNKNYVLGDDILNMAPVFTKGCRSSRDFIKKKNIDGKSYIYARLCPKDKVWSINDGKSAKLDKVLIRHIYAKTINELGLNQDQATNNNDQIVNNNSNIDIAPEIIYLNDEEKFKDDQDNVVEIETRGIRELDKIYFKVKDVMTGFDMPSLYDVIIDERKSYKLNTDYKYFMCKYTANCGKNTGRKVIASKELFLTYEGMLRVLFVSRNKKTTKFVSWATKILFAAQLGTVEQKNELVSNIKGVSYETIQELFSINARSLPCVYLTAFNNVGTLRDKLNIDQSIPDDSIVYKFGLTKSFADRKNGHKKEYKSIADLIDMKLIYYTYIDPLYLADAEKEIKTLLEDYKISWDNHEELVIIPNNILKFIKKIYENIGMKYSGHTEEFNRQILELNKVIETLKLQMDNQKIMHDKDIEVLKVQMKNNKIIHEKELENKDLIITNKDLLNDNLIKELKIKELELRLIKQ
jgi:hypothetical protein